MTLFFVGATWGIVIYFKPAAQIQLVPVILSSSVGILVLWCVITLIFGRIYCSTVCPMGYLQDIFSRLRRLNGHSRIRHRYTYTAPRNTMRYTTLVVVAIATLASIPFLLSLLDPYSAFGRIAALILHPLFDPSSLPVIAGGTLIGLIIAVVTLVGIAFWSFRSGRSFCNTLCPVGTTLSILSRKSLYRIDINTDLCSACGLCSDNCKARCINPQDHTVDTSRCVVCFDCIDICPSEAIRYTRHRFQPAWPMFIRVAKPAPTPLTNPDSINTSTSRPIDRRHFMTTGLIAASIPAINAADDRLRHFDAAILSQNASEDHRPVYPPGVTSLRRFITHCTGCAACISACPARVLRPSAPGLNTFSSTLHPVMDYDNSYCRYNCNICTRTCPTGALTPLNLDIKQATPIGLASVNSRLCIGCGKCASFCPRKAITMTAQANGGRIPAVDPTLCNGCGACQYICPAAPDRAIIINGITR